MLSLHIVYTRLCVYWVIHNNYYTSSPKNRHGRSRKYAKLRLWILIDSYSQDARVTVQLISRFHRRRIGCEKSKRHRGLSKFVRRRCIIFRSYFWRKKTEIGYDGSSAHAKSILSALKSLEWGSVVSFTNHFEILSCSWRHCAVNIVIIFHVRSSEFGVLVLRVKWVRRMTRRTDRSSYDQF